MILHLTRDYPPRWRGGLSTAVAATVRGLDFRGIDSRVISLDRSAAKRGGGGGGEPLSSTLAVLRVGVTTDESAIFGFAARTPPSLVHVHDPLLWPLGRAVAQKYGVAAVHTLHVLSHHQDRLRGLARPSMTSEAQFAAISQASAIIAPSASVAELAHRDFPSAASRIHRARLAVEVPPDDSARARAPMALFAARFSDLSGIADLVSLLGLLGPRLPVTVAGGLPENRRAEKKWLDALREAAAAAGTELTTLGWLSPRELAAVRQRATIFLAPCHYATFGLAVAEAMAAGLAVCAYASGGIADLITDGANGVLAAPDPAAIASRVLELLEQPDAARSIGIAARAQIRQHYTAAVATAELCDVYALLGTNLPI